MSTSPKRPGGGPQGMLVYILVTDNMIYCGKTDTPKQYLHWQTQKSKVGKKRTGKSKRQGDYKKYINRMKGEIDKPVIMAFHGRQDPKILRQIGDPDKSPKSKHKFVDYLLWDDMTKRIFSSKKIFEQNIYFVPIGIVKSDTPIEVIGLKKANSDGGDKITSGTLEELIIAKSGVIDGVEKKADSTEGRFWRAGKASTDRKVWNTRQDWPLSKKLERIRKTVSTLVGKNKHFEKIESFENFEKHVTSPTEIKRYDARRVTIDYEGMSRFERIKVRLGVVEKEKISKTAKIRPIDFGAPFDAEKFNEAVSEDYGWKRQIWYRWEVVKNSQTIPLIAYMKTKNEAGDERFRIYTTEQIEQRKKWLEPEDAWANRWVVLHVVKHHDTYYIYLIHEMDYNPKMVLNISDLEHPKEPVFLIKTKNKKFPGLKLKGKGPDKDLGGDGRDPPPSGPAIQSGPRWSMRSPQITTNYRPIIGRMPGILGHNERAELVRQQPEQQQVPPIQAGTEGRPERTIDTEPITEPKPDLLAQIFDQFGVEGEADQGYFEEMLKTGMSVEDIREQIELEYGGGEYEDPDEDEEPEWEYEMGEAEDAARLLAAMPGKERPTTREHLEEEEPWSSRKEREVPMSPPAPDRGPLIEHDAPVVDPDILRRSREAQERAEAALAAVEPTKKKVRFEPGIRSPTPDKSSKIQKERKWRGFDADPKTLKMISDDSLPNKKARVTMGKTQPRDFIIQMVYEGQDITIKNERGKGDPNPDADNVREKMGITKTTTYKDSDDPKHARISWFEGRPDNMIYVKSYPNKLKGDGLSIYVYDVKGLRIKIQRNSKTAEVLSVKRMGGD